MTHWLFGAALGISLCISSFTFFYFTYGLIHTLNFDHKNCNIYMNHDVHLARTLLSQRLPFERVGYQVWALNTASSPNTRGNAGIPFVDSYQRHIQLNITYHKYGIWFVFCFYVVSNESRFFPSRNFPLPLFLTPRNYSLPWFWHLGIIVDYEPRCNWQLPYLSRSSGPWTALQLSIMIIYNSTWSILIQ